MHSFGAQVVRHGWETSSGCALAFCRAACGTPCSALDTWPTGSAGAPPPAATREVLLFLCRSARWYGAGHAERQFAPRGGLTSGCAPAANQHGQRPGARCGQRVELHGAVQVRDGGLDEVALRPARVRDLQALVLHLQLVVEDDVQVQGTGSPPLAAKVPAQVGLQDQTRTSDLLRCSRRQGLGRADVSGACPALHRARLQVPEPQIGSGWQCSSTCALGNSCCSLAEVHCSAQAQEQVVTRGVPLTQQQAQQQCWIVSAAPSCANLYQGSPRCP